MQRVSTAWTLGLHVDGLGWQDIRGGVSTSKLLGTRPFSLYLVDSIYAVFVSSRKTAHFQRSQKLKNAKVYLLYWWIIHHCVVYRYNYMHYAL